jgi:hypothetical protein
MTETEELLHKLWTKAVGTPGYDKSEWKALRRAIDEPIERIEAIPEDAALVVVTVDVGNLPRERWSNYAINIAEPFKEKFEGRTLVLPKNITVEALNQFGILEKLADLMPDVAAMLAIPKPEPKK